MKLSMPLAVLSAIKESREHRISVKGGKFMEAMAEADTLVFDKTGTLTHATPTLMNVVTFDGRDPDEMLRIAACLEEHYPHSVANAIVKGAKDKGLDHDELHQLITLRQISTALMKRIKSNYRFILGFNSALIAGGLFGIMNPASSALLHNGSTILTQA